MVAYVTWRNYYTVGDESLDAQHKQILGTISEANIRLRQGVPVDHLLSRVVFALAPRPQTTRS